VCEKFVRNSSKVYKNLKGVWMKVVMSVLKDILKKLTWI
jgi:hypothetical protein